MFYIAIKHNGHLVTRGKWRTHKPQQVFLHFSSVLNVQSVLSQCNIQLRPRHLLYDINLSNTAKKAIKHVFSMFYTLTKHEVLTNQSMHRVLFLL